MKRKLMAVFLLLSQTGAVSAAGSYDGNWIGTASAVHRRCHRGSIQVTVLDRTVSGHAIFAGRSTTISGVISADGALIGLIGAQNLTGKFSDTRFLGTFSRFVCTWTVSLSRAH